MAAIALQVSAKWLDNLLSHVDVPGIPKGRQGAEREIAATGLLAIAAIRDLNFDVGVPLARAAAIVRLALEDAPGRGALSFRTPSGITIGIDVGGIEQELRVRLVEAAESAPVIPRGRRPRRRPADQK